MLRSISCLLLTVALSFSTCSAVWADNEGLEKLDEATVMKLEADTPDKLAKVVALCEEAMKLGLDEDNTALAKQILAGSAFERAQMTVQQLPAVANNPTALNRLRNATMKDLEKAVANDPMLSEALILMARLEALPGGSREKSLGYLNQAIDALKDKPVDQSKVYVLRAGLQESNDDKLADLNKAVAVDPTNAEALQVKIALQLALGKLQEVLDEAGKMLEENSDNIFAFEAAIQAMVGLEKYDEAIDLLTKRIEKDEENGNLYRIRGTIYEQKEANDKALEDLNRAIELNPRDFQSLVARGRLNYLNGDVEQANRDISDALLIEPNSVQGVLMRSLVAAQESRFADAIADMEMLVRADPSNSAWIMQLASFYQMDDRPRLAIKLLDELVRVNEKDWRAMRLRGDAKLSISEHDSAIADYEDALRMMEESREVADDARASDTDYSGLLNNLSWVLSTTPKDDLRDGKRSLELALKACEATEYKEAHILSTLAAAYAETGDFEKAREWAGKAVEVAEGEENPQLEQLKEELETYKQNKAWREEQKTEENDKPLTSADDTIDT